MSTEIIGIVNTAVGAVPPLTDLSMEALPFNPYFDTSLGLQRPGLGFNVNAFGMRYIIDSTTPGYGTFERGGLVEYARRVITIQVVTQLADGNFVIATALESKANTGYITWPFAFPDHIDVICDPGVTVNLFWLLFLIP